LVRIALDMVTIDGKFVGGAIHNGRQSNPFTWYGKFAIAPVEIPLTNTLPIVMLLPLFYS
jgi:hypothetical protein